MTIAPLIKAEHINFSKGGYNILKDISITINSKDFITIIGPNGAGKSSLLKILLGIYKLKNKNYGVITKSKNLKIGYVPQKITLDHTMPISVEYFLKLNKDIDNESYQQILQETRIAELMDRQLYDISGGELQRVMIARALLARPNLLILDEPVQNLDVSSQLEFYKLINHIYENNNIAILMVSHDLHLVLSKTKKVICLYKHICCEGEPYSITQHSEFISVFGKDISEIMATYNHTHNHTHHHN